MDGRPLLPLSEADIAAFEAQGFLMVRSVVGAADCAAIADIAWSMMPPGFDQADPHSWTGRIQDCCNNIPLYQRKGLVRFKAADGFRSHLPVMRGIHENLRLQALFRALCPAEPEVVRVRGLNPNLPFPRLVSLNQLFGNRLDEEVSGGLFDRIVVPCPPQFPIPGHLEAHSTELGAFIYLSDIGPDAGGVAVWPGSHRMMRVAFESPTDFKPNKLYPRFDRMLQGRRPLVVEGCAGDVLLFHNRLLHANTYNRAQAVRHLAVVDVLGAGWKERAGTNPHRSRRKKLLAAPAVEKTDFVRSVLKSLPFAPLSAFLARFPRLSGWIQGLSKDPVAAGRSHLSARIRKRRDGDVWVIVSQGDDHAHSYKLDAYGRARLGRYGCSLDGAPMRKSLCGMLVEQYQLENGRHTLLVKGRFKTAHHLRVLQTRTPFSASPILLSAVIPAGAGQYQAAFALTGDLDRMESLRRIEAGETGALA